MKLRYKGDGRYFVIGYSAKPGLIIEVDDKQETKRLLQSGVYEEVGEEKEDTRQEKEKRGREGKEKKEMEFIPDEVLQEKIGGDVVFISDYNNKEEGGEK